MIKIAICRKDVYGDALSVLLDKADGFNVVGIFGNPVEAVETLHITPNVLLIDIAGSLHETCRQIQVIKANYPPVKLLMLTDADDTDSIIGTVRAGVDGYLLLNTSLLMLREAITEVSKDGFPVSPVIARSLLQMLSNSPEKPLADSLTDREKEVLEQLVNGMSYKLISANLGIAINTVRSHIKKLYEKLDVNSKSEAVSKALRQRLVEAG
ncbi:MAG TPA: response regulator transcription factor [Chryseosolibacter sp.]|nr:response regulator transcription factor [Chryseosolibacter sp.]